MTYRDYGGRGDEGLSIPLITNIIKKLWIIEVNYISNSYSIDTRVTLKSFKEL